ncbi:M13 family metallopeptidase [Mycoplasmopsis alligatoris]|uniref:Peptidase family M13 n=1 Tax=Mycoplasmopsis alligatoris A21JP2 TaxID=747682 RepID=D4XWG9_9BACT|nr:M13 family metallopeptidase [Mycoplasmopsis alligatoris]EFF41363.1 peptidase family M13 [Mycoplasmopsis alligatoris A21JP2]
MDKNALKQDFYNEVNKKWLKESKILSDRSSTGSFSEIDIALEDKLRNLLDSWAKKPELVPNDKYIIEMMKFYKMATSFDKINSLGFEPLKQYLNKIEELKSFDELLKNYKYFVSKFEANPFEFSVYADFKNPDIQVLYLDSPRFFLPEKSYYADEKKKEKLIKSLTETVTKLLTKYGKSKNEIEHIIKCALIFDESLVSWAKSAEEDAQIVGYYNPFSPDELKKVVVNYDLIKLAEKLLNQSVDKIILSNKRFPENIDKVFNKNTFENFKWFMFVKNLLKNSYYLSEEIRVITDEFKRAITGIEKSKNKEKHAYELATSLFDIPFGTYYGKEFFGQKAKQNVEKMIQNMIGIYKTRLENNNWLSKKTIEKALLKLSNLEVMVGYPEVMQSYFDSYVVDEYENGGSLVSNIFKFVESRWLDNMSQYLKPENKKYWGMSPAVVNAYFHPTKNHIVFPAGILQSPFYSYEVNSSLNYGGIGAVIAHEISHGFDNNGSQFDEKGRLFNWWTEEDLKQFQSKAQGMINLFEGRETEFGKCNGTLTLSENIADAGGFSCALAAAKLEKDFDIEKFFTSWAIIWKTKYREETAKMLLVSDVHAPTKLRANVQLMNSKEFQKYYGVDKNDKMYLDEKDIVEIW